MDAITQREASLRSCICQWTQMAQTSIRDARFNERRDPPYLNPHFAGVFRKLAFAYSLRALCWEEDLWAFHRSDPVHFQQP